MVEISDVDINRIKNNLVQFGYQNLTFETVKKQVNLVLNGERPTDIIGMLARDMLVKNGFVQETDE